MTGAPTLAEIGLSSDVQKILEAAQSVVTEPSERWAKESNTVRFGDKKLPERVTVYRRLTGRAAELATATISKSLAKKAPDGGPVFVRTQEECAVSVPAFVDQTCEVCKKVSGKAKQFYSIENYEGHMNALHEIEWRGIQRRIDREERKEERELMRQLVQATQKEAPNGIQVSTQAEVATASSGDEAFACDTCGKEVKSAFGLQAHKRSHLS